MTFEQILAWENLCAAWEAVADNRGAAGSDAVSVARFARNWEANLRRLQTLVAGGRYRPGGLRRVAVPKRSGGQRVLAIANVGDRVLQRAALQVLAGPCDAGFLPCSFGYRPGRSLHDAVAAILHWRDAGCTWLVDADIDECFDSLDHALLRRFVAEAAPDPRTQALIGLWLINGRRQANPPRGIAQGLPISPLLCNLYLHRLDAALTARRRRLVRYADDFVVFCRSRKQAERVYEDTGRALADLRLCYEPSKTRITSFEQGFDFLGVHFEGITYAFTWQEEQVRVVGPTPPWVWGKLPHGYE
jgi:group II intron reverse transcriptase/maturase